jgi:predicted neuraminidase
VTRRPGDHWLIALSRTLLPLLVLSAVCLPALLSGWRAEESRRFASPAVTAEAGALPLYSERFIAASPSPRSLDTPALSELPSGDLLAVWKAARSENASVALMAARYDRRAEAWRQVRQVTSSRATQEELGRPVATLSNPVILTRPDGMVSLFYVTAWWEWSTASVALKSSTDHGDTWGPSRRIVTSPVANLGTLTKMAPVLFTDGSVGVPAYQELMGVFPQLLRVSADGSVVEKVRIHRGQVALQPSIVPLNGQEAIALMRNYERGSVLVARTRDAGQSWSPVEAIGLPNPNSPVMGVRLRDGAILLAFNNSASSRDDLSLALSRDVGRRWTILHTFEEGDRTTNGSRVNFGYPYVIRASDGVIHLVYSWHHTHVKHVSFNEAWIRQRAR